MSEKEWTADDFTGDELTLLEYIFKTGMIDAEVAAEELGMSLEWVKANLDALIDKGVLYSMGGPTKVYKVFLRGGPLDGLNMEMLVAENGDTVRFTAPVVEQHLSNLLMSTKRRFAPCGMWDGEVSILVGMAQSDVTATVYRYNLKERNAKSQEGVDLYYSGLVAAGTRPQMQAMLDAEVGRMLRRESEEE